MRAARSDRSDFVGSAQKAARRQRAAGTNPPRTGRVRSWWTSTIAEEARMSARASAAIPPSAARLTESLRDIGYDFPAAVADLVDNSIMAGAARVDIVIEFDGADSLVSVADDGRGMTANGLTEALR